MDLTASLVSDLGLTPTEAGIYLAGLRFPRAGVRDLVRVTGVKRPTVYHALETLLAKGLVAKSADGAKTAYAMTPPERLGGLIDRRIDALSRQKRSLDAILPHLAERAAGGVGGERVAHFEGVAGVKTAVEEALYCRSGRWDIIAPRKNFFSEFSAEYAAYFMETRRRRGIVARSLWERSAAGPGRILTAAEIKNRQPRYLPKMMHGKLSSVVILFDDAVLTISSSDESSAVLVRSKGLHATMAAMFEGLWSVSEPYLSEKKS
jgi:sugar-specific transcriptional regulator TrmB